MPKYRKGGIGMIPDEVMRELYLSDEFIRIPCVFQSMFIDALEKSLAKTKTTIVEVENATIHES